MNLALNYLPVKCHLNVVSVPASREESICVYYLLRRTDRNDAEKIDSSVWAFELGVIISQRGSLQAEMKMIVLLRAF